MPRSHSRAHGESTRRRRTTARRPRSFLRAPETAPPERHAPHPCHSHACGAPPRSGRRWNGPSGGCLPRHPDRRPAEAAASARILFRPRARRVPPRTANAAVPFAPVVPAPAGNCLPAPRAARLLPVIPAHARSRVHRAFCAVPAKGRPFPRKPGSVEIGEKDRTVRAGRPPVPRDPPPLGRHAPCTFSLSSPRTRGSGISTAPATRTSAIIPAHPEIRGTGSVAPSAPPLSGAISSRKRRGRADAIRRTRLRDLDPPHAGSAAPAGASPGRGTFIPADAGSRTAAGLDRGGPHPRAGGRPTRPWGVPCATPAVIRALAASGPHHHREIVLGAGHPRTRGDARPTAIMATCWAWQPSRTRDPDRGHRDRPAPPGASGDATGAGCRSVRRATSSCAGDDPAPPATAARRPQRRVSAPRARPSRRIRSRS